MTPSWLWAAKGKTHSLPRSMFWEQLCSIWTSSISSYICWEFCQRCKNKIVFRFPKQNKQREGEQNWCVLRKLWIECKWTMPIMEPEEWTTANLRLCGQLIKWSFQEKKKKTIGTSDHSALQWACEWVQYGVQILFSFELYGRKVNTQFWQYKIQFECSNLTTLITYRVTFTTFIIYGIYFLLTFFYMNNVHFTCRSSTKKNRSYKEIVSHLVVE